MVQQPQVKAISEVRRDTQTTGLSHSPISTVTLLSQTTLNSRSLTLERCLIGGATLLTHAEGSQLSQLPRQTLNITVTITISLNVTLFSWSGLAPVAPGPIEEDMTLLAEGDVPHSIEPTPIANTLEPSQSPPNFQKPPPSVSPSPSTGGPSPSPPTTPGAPVASPSIPPVQPSPVSAAAQAAGGAKPLLRPPTMPPKPQNTDGGL